MGHPTPSYHGEFASPQPQNLSFTFYAHYIFILRYTLPPLTQKGSCYTSDNENLVLNSNIILNIESTTLIKCRQRQDSVTSSFMPFTFKYKIWTAVSAH